MDKKLIYVISAVFIGSILFCTGYVLAENKIENIDKGEYKENIKDIENKVTFRSIKKKKDKIIEAFDVTINGITEIFKVEFSKEASGSNAAIRGKVQDKTFYYDNLGMSDEEIETKFTEENLKKNFTESNFHFIEGEDGKSYLLVTAQNKTSEKEASYMYLLNDKMDILEGDLSYDSLNKTDYMTIYDESVSFKSTELKGYEDKLGICEENSCLINISLEESKIYYIKAFPKCSKDDSGYLEERVYTIRENKLNYTIKNRYKITESQGYDCN